MISRETLPPSLLGILVYRLFDKFDLTLLLHSFEFVVVSCSRERGGIGANHKPDYDCCSKVLTQLDKLVLESFKFSVVCLVVVWVNCLLLRVEIDLVVK